METMKGITVNVKSIIEFEILVLANSEHWEEATKEQQREFIYERIKEHIEENIDVLASELLDNSNISYK